MKKAKEKDTPSSVAPDVVLGNWTRDDIPKCDGWSVFVLNGAWYQGVVRMFALAGFQKAEKIEDADLVVFTGGADINPALYGEQAIKETNASAKERDLFEEAIYRQCKNRGIPMMGICRGMQFLWAMNGGKLWQHINNHANGPHYIVDLEEDLRVKVTSFHHQSCVWDNEIGASLLAITEDNVATQFKSEDLEINLSPADMDNYDGELEVEAAFFDETKCFMVQGHPEVGSPEYVSWTMTKLSEKLLEWDIVKSTITEEVKAQIG